MPDPPIGIFGNNVTASSFTANWSAVTSATHYLVDVWTETTSLHTNLLVSATSVMVTGLSAGTIYSYRIRAVNATGTSAYSVTTDQLLLPAAPIASTETSKIVSGLTPEKIYYYRVRAINTTGTSSNSENIAVELKVNENYIRAIDVLVNGTTSFAQVEELVREGHVARYSFFDGLGRPMKNIMRGRSPLGNDIVQPIVYDNFGREQRKYLPFVANGWFEESGATSYESAVLDFYNNTGDDIADDAKPWAETAFEPSPLNRVLKQGAPGSAWQPESGPYATATDHSVKYAFEANVADEVLLWTHTPPTPAFPLGMVDAGTSAAPTYYNANELHKSLTKDEHQHEVIEFKDKQGRIVLKKVRGPDNTWALTYYIYDDFGQLVCVIPPEAVSRLASEYYHVGSSNETKRTFLARWLSATAMTEENAWSSSKCLEPIPS